MQRSDLQADPPPPPLSPSQSGPILGVQLILYILYFVSWILVVYLLKVSWQPLSAVPSASAVTGTCWSKRSPSLFAFRFTLAAWQLCVLSALIGSNAISPKHHGHWAFQFFFFTVWNYVLQTVAWGVAASASAMALCSASGPRPWQRRLTHTLLSMCVPMSMLVSIVLVRTAAQPHGLSPLQPHSLTLLPLVPRGSGGSSSPPPSTPATALRSSTSSHTTCMQPTRCASSSRRIAIGYSSREGPYPCCSAGRSSIL